MARTVAPAAPQPDGGPADDFMKPSTSDVDDVDDKSESAKDYLSGWSRAMRRALEATFLFLNFGIAMVTVLVSSKPGQAR